MTEGIGSAPTATSSAPSMGAGSSMGNSSGGFEGKMGNASGFSSKGLATFKSGPESPSKPIVDINHGKENKSMFKNPDQFGEKKSIFDTSRPIANHPIVPHENTPKPQHAENKGNSIIDINRGRENIPMFKNPEQLNAKKNMFDVSKPIFQETGSVSKPAYDDKIESHKPEVKPLDKVSSISEENKPIEFKKIEPKASENTSEKPNPFKNTVSLWERPKAESVQKETLTNKTGEQPATQSLNKNSGEKLLTNTAFQKEENHVVQPVLKTEPGLKTSTKSVQKLETNLNSTPSLSAEPKVNILPEIKTDGATFPQAKNEHQTALQPEVRTKVLTKTSTQTKPLTEVVTAMPQASPETKVLVALDVAYATALIPKIMTATNVSQSQAEQMVTKALMQKYESKPEVKVLQQTKTETSAKTEVLPKTQTQQQVKVEQMVEIKLKKTDVSKKHVVKEVRDKIIEKMKLEKKVLFFEKDTNANKSRVLEAINRAQFLLYKRQKEGIATTGKDVADIMPQNGNKNVMSEIVQTRSFDGSYENFKNDLENMGPVDSISDVKKEAEKIAEKNTAVRLTFGTPEKGASGRDAVKVYQQPLDGVEAYVKEDGSVGHLYSNEVVREVEYINRSKTREYPVATELPENVEVEISA